MINHMQNKDLENRIKEIYQVVEYYYSCMDGYTLPDKKILKTFISKEKAQTYCDKLDEKRKLKMEVLKEVGIPGYQDIFSKYQYCIEKIWIDE